MKEKDNKSIIAYVLLALSIVIVMVLGSAYAYFSTGTTNNFGTTTIEGYADSVGSVTLVGTNANIRLNLSGSNMAQSANDITYWGTASGTPSTTQNVVTLGSTTVTGEGYYDCSYTLNVAASGTNNMYTAFQGMSGKSTEQIVLKVGEAKYDFNTSSLFPITINGTLSGVSASNIQSITAEFYIVNKNNVIQNALAGTDISMSITATSFTCTAVEEPTVTVLYYTYDSEKASQYNWGANGYTTDKLISPDMSWQYYIKETSEEKIAEEDIYSFQNYSGGQPSGNPEGQMSLSKCQETEQMLNGNGKLCVKTVSLGETYTKRDSEACAIFNGTEVCLKPNDFSNATNYYAVMNGLGLLCNPLESLNAANILTCISGTIESPTGSLYCSIDGNGKSKCGIYNESSCFVNGDSIVRCTNS